MSPVQPYVTISCLASRAVRHSTMRILSNSHHAAGWSPKRFIWPILPASSWTTRSNTPRRFSTGNSSESEALSPERSEYLQGKPGPSEDGQMDPQQQKIYDLILNENQSVFFTGPAGSGKTWLLKEIIKGLQAKHLVHYGSDAKLGITASTGIAASGIGGTTLHRFAGIFLGEAPVEVLIKGIIKDTFKLELWKNIDVLIIDEISMVDAVLFDKLDKIAQITRENERPFGGIQLILSGDFFQLPPVVKGRDRGPVRFCFESEAWQRTIRHTISLTEVYRQKDNKFVRMLNELRVGRPSPSTIKEFKRLSRPLRRTCGKEPTVLFPLRRQVDEANIRRLQELPGPEKTYIANDTGTLALLNNCMAPETVQLKKGAQVMLIKNIDNDLVNGSQGEVIGFTTSDTWDPDEAESYHNDGQSTTYHIPPWEHGEPRGYFPVVRFKRNDGETRTIVCKPARWTVEQWFPVPDTKNEWYVEILAARFQVPLVLGWAMSIHKAQGQTLGLVKVDLANAFEKGQVYVALSRAVCRRKLQVLNFDPDKVVVHPRLKGFYANLSKPPNSDI